MISEIIQNKTKQTPLHCKLSGPVTDVIDTVDTNTHYLPLQYVRVPKKRRDKKTPDFLTLSSYNYDDRPPNCDPGPPPNKNVGLYQTGNGKVTRPTVRLLTHLVGRLVSF